jgi:hypothetical protein
VLKPQIPIRVKREHLGMDVFAALNARRAETLGMVEMDEFAARM